MGIATVNNNRIYRLKGTPREIGFNHGRALKDVFEEYIHLYVEDGLQALNRGKSLMWKSYGVVRYHGFVNCHYDFRKK